MRTSDDAIKELIKGGYRGMEVAGSPGQPECILYTRGWNKPFMDEVIIRDEDDATACRLRLDNEANLVERKLIVWRKDGSVVDVVDEILFHLPHPANPRAPKLMIPTPGSLWAPPGARTKSIRNTRRLPTVGFLCLW